jgi:hypothetical protein
VKVSDLYNSKSAVRVVSAAALTWALVAGASAPLVANAEVATAPAIPAVSASTTATPAADATPAAAASGVTTPAVATVVVKKAPPKKLTVKQTIAKVGHDARLSNSEVAALLWIAKRESNYHPTSVSSGGCYGLFQLSRGMAGGHPWKDPSWNTKRAIKYMKGRYHGVLKAKAFWQSHHWY